MEIRLIGDLAIIRNGESLPLPNSRKTRALLGYLVLNPGPQRRERICEIFWQVPDDPRGSLRWSLSKLRGLVDDDKVKRIVADRDTVAFDPAQARIDIHALRDALSTGLDSLATETLAEYASIASQGLLRGADLSGQPEFDVFLSREREAFRLMRRELLFELIRRHRSVPADAVPWLQDLLDVEPYSLQAHVTLIETLVRAGRKGDAERQLKASLSALSEMDGIDLAPLRHAAAVKPPATAGVAMPADSRHVVPLDQQVRFCMAADGTKIAYATVGEGPPLIKTANWLNHLDFDWESPVWRHVFRGLAEGRTLIRYDARGNGLSDWDVDDFSLERQLSDLEAVVETVGLERFPLLGISQGCAISVEFAVRHPEKVSKLVLLGGYARGWNRVGSPDIVRQAEAMITLVAIGWGRDNPAFRQMFTTMFMPDAPPENQAWFNELQRITTTPRNAARLLRALGEIDVIHRLAEVRTPTLVLHARGDMRIDFLSGREIASGIPGARFVCLDSNNHIMPETDPAWPVALKEIRDFLAE
ncbi:MAG TPA: alpha/beta fold hydrolase [Woeseiaceae bacterium]|nr:alpha/beta fold hydrolase [Woeseiaceae bacterium]